MDLKLNGKVALITGAGSPVGFGRGIALVLAAQGCDIIANDIDAEGVQQTAGAVEALGQKALAVKADVTNMAEVDAMVRTAIEKFGRIDILVNNAGQASPPQAFVDTPPATIEKVINLNLYGTFYCARAVLPGMLARKSGSIVNISSGAGLSGMPRCLAYGASKAAVMAFTKGLAKEVIGSGIRVNSVAPGLGDTNFLKTANFPMGELDKALTTIPSGKTTTPEEIGNMVAYLVSDLASNIVGQVIFVDGGHCIR